MSTTIDPNGIMNPFTDLPPATEQLPEGRPRVVNGRSLNIGNSDTGFKADRSGIWQGAKKFADAPFSVDLLGNTRVNVLTNKTIFFETIAAPAVPMDGQLWCADNLPNKKVLWGYFGGDTTHRQQISMSRMQDSFAFDYTSNQTITVNTWFQPRQILFNGFVENSADQKFGVTNGQAGVVSPRDGFSNSILLDFATLSNVMSSPLVNAYSLLDCDGVTCHMVSSLIGYTLTNLLVVENIKIGVLVDAIGGSSVDKEVYLYVDDWSDTSVTLKLVCPAGWRMAGSFTVIG